MHASGAKVLFIEVQNTNPKDLAQKYDEVAITSPDYKGMESSAAVSFVSNVTTLKNIYLLISN